MVGSTALLLLTAQTSLLTLDPPWSMIFPGETVTLTCQGSHLLGQGATAWYHNDKFFAHTDTYTYRITNAKQKQTGKYQCQSPGSMHSNSVTLTISSDWLILQVPSYMVFEGDPLHMRCRGWNNWSVSMVKYYKDGADITPQYASAELSIPRAQTNHSGRYHCIGWINSISSLIKRESQVLHVSVQELFSSPVLSLDNSTEPLEGSPLVMSCVTHLSPHKSHTHLQYLFYRNGTVLQGPKSFLKYWVPAVQLAESGSYSCEVRTETSSVQKWSPQIPITVKRVPVSGVSLKVHPHGGQVKEGEPLVLTCLVMAGTGPISFSWHREGSAQVLGRDTRYVIPSAQGSDSGLYYCTASNGNTPAQSPQMQVTVMGAPQLFYCYIRAPLLLAGLGTLLSGVVAVHVLAWVERRGTTHPVGGSVQRIFRGQLPFIRSLTI
ncbi:Fc receptor-like protein 4 [Struthio camelus]|uniref:Fc receptor-like protein 4 n=1 Tax=Struthio camelus TaxID=8801 RepID=UPI003603AD25